MSRTGQKEVNTTGERARKGSNSLETPKISLNPLLGFRGSVPS